MPVRLPGQEMRRKFPSLFTTCRFKEGAGTSTPATYKSPHSELVLPVYPSDVTHLDVKQQEPVQTGARCCYNETGDPPDSLTFLLFILITVKKKHGDPIFIWFVH